MNLSALRSDAAHAGWAQALAARAMKWLQACIGLRIYRVNVRPFPEPPVEPALSPGITLRALVREELLEAAADPDLELDPEFVRNALARGDLAFGAFEDGCLVSYTWRSSSAAPFADGLWVRIAPPLHYAYSAFTRASHRGRRLHAAVTHLVDRYSVESGHAAEVGMINLSNLESVGAAKSLGRRKVGYAGYLRLFGRCITFRTAGTRKIGVGLFKPSYSTDRTSPPSTSIVVPVM